MKRAASSRDVTAAIASWASSLLASSLLLAIVTLFAIFVIAGVGDWSREHPVAAISVVLVLACYATSFVCLHRLQKEAVNSIPRWSLSLVAACAPLVALMYWFDAGSAVLAIGVVEVAAVLLHLVAIGILVARKATAGRRRASA